MDVKNLIPYPESLPAPAQIFIFLEQLFFLIHIVLVNSILGLSLITIYKAFKSSESMERDKSIAKQIPILFAFAINMAIPALLFIQVVFGHLFYTSSVIIGTFWIMIIPLLVIAYYSSYFHYKKFKNSGLAKSSLLIVIFIMFYIAFILVNNLSLMEEPEQWKKYFENRTGTILMWNTLSIYPRYLHFIIGSIAIGGLFYSLYYKFRKDMEQKLQNLKIKEGLKIFSYATMFQIFAGILFLLSLPERVLLNFIGGDFLATIVFVSGIIFAIIALFSGLKEKLSATAFFLFLTLIAMIINRYHLRIFQLGENFRIAEFKVMPQWDVFVIFLLILVAGIAVILYMLRVAFFREGKV
ncbi:hypothetical protein V4D30_06590 [Thermodesulfovibrio sp. 3907-1M]|uniref:Uncharacterized protein n=1 Tax=Thermodesulfovibrio autotrophicus TaxID=3118333 RepID=A0AAU8GWP3_9BACT